MLYAHHKNLDYFSTECIYSPEAFRGSARALIKNLERMRPSSILDIVRSGEDLAQLVPGFQEQHAGNCSNKDAGDGLSANGCGTSQGQNSGGEMERMEKQLSENERAKSLSLEVDISLNLSKSLTDTDHPRQNGSASQGLAGSPKPVRLPIRQQQGPKQTMGRCETCGYLSSQRICKACVLLEGLNKNRPKHSIAESCVKENPRVDDLATSQHKISVVDE